MVDNRYCIASALRFAAARRSVASRRGHPTRAASSLPRALARSLLTCLLLAAGCSIEKPELPKFTTTLAVPLGTRRVTIAEMLDDRSFLTVGADSALALTVSGGPDTLDVFPDLGLDLASAHVSAVVGGFTLDASDPAQFDFSLGQVYAPAVALDGRSVPVPPFAFDLTGAPADLPDVRSATVTSGRLVVSVTNGLPVPVAGADTPELVTIALTDPGTGAALATATFDTPIAPGATATASADLAGVVLPDSLGVRLFGGSPGSSDPVLVDAQARLQIAARLQEVRVESALATIGPQAFTERTRLALPDTLRIVEAEIRAGSLPLAVRNGLAIPCRAVLTLPEIVDDRDQPLVSTFELAPGESAERTLDLAGTRARRGDGSPLDSLTVRADVTSPGSGGAVVALAAADTLGADVTPAHLHLGAVTGELPRRAFALPASTQEIDLPDEMDGVTLTSAALTLAVSNGADTPARLAFTLTGRSADGATATLEATADIAPAVARAPVRTDIVLDQTNSTIVAFLNNLPTTVTLSGEVTVGGEGALATVRPGDQASVGWRIDAPVTVVVEPSVHHGRTQPLGLDGDLRDRLAEHAGAARLVADVNSHLPFAVEIRILAGADSATVTTAPSLAVGPLTAGAGSLHPQLHMVSGARTTRCDVALTAGDVAVLTAPRLFLAIEVTLPGTDGQRVTISAADWFTVAGAVIVDYEVAD